jgi:hypothetical protein
VFLAVLVALVVRELLLVPVVRPDSSGSYALSLCTSCLRLRSDGSGRIANAAVEGSCGWEDSCL